MIERDVESYLVERVKALGGEVRKVKWIGRKSAPDRLVMLPGFSLRHAGDADPKIQEYLVRVQQAISKHGVGGLSIWVELKRPGKKATFPADAHERAQHREHERMRGMGQRVEVIDSIEGVDEVLA